MFSSVSQEVSLLVESENARLLLRKKSEASNAEVKLMGLKILAALRCTEMKIFKKMREF